MRERQGIGESPHTGEGWKRAMKSMERDELAAGSIYCRARDGEAMWREGHVSTKEMLVRTVPGDQLVERLQWRYATKKFDPTRRIAADVWTALEKSVTLAPSSFGLQPWKFIVVSDAALRARLREKAWNQSQVTDSSHLVVFARRTSVDRAHVLSHIDRIAEVRGVTRESLMGYRDTMIGFIEKPSPVFDSSVWASRQVYIALGFFLSACAMMGVDACPMEGIDAAAFDEILDLKKDGLATQVLAAAGYRASDDWAATAAKVRFCDDQVIEHR